MFTCSQTRAGNLGGHERQASTPPHGVSETALPPFVRRGKCWRFRGTTHWDTRRLRLRSHGLAHVREGMWVPSTWFARASRCGVASALAPVIAFCFEHTALTRGYGWGHGCPTRCSPSPAHHRRIVAHRHAIGMPLARGTRHPCCSPSASRGRAHREAQPALASKNSER